MRPRRVLLAAAASFVIAGSPAREISTDLRFAFEANRGQAEAEVRFLHRAEGFRVRLFSDALVVDRDLPTGEPPLSLRFRDASRDVRVEGIGDLPGRAHHLIGRDPARWVTNVPMFEAVAYRGLYPGVDLEVRAEVRRLTLRFDLAPGADPSEILQSIDVSSGLTLEARGATLTVAPVDRPVEDPAPGDGIRVAVDAEGSVYVAGSARAASGIEGSFVAKLGPDFKTAEWVTYLGGDGPARLAGLVVGPGGEAAVNARMADSGLVVATLAADGSSASFSTAPDESGDMSGPDSRAVAPDGSVVRAGSSISPPSASAVMVAPVLSGAVAWVDREVDPGDAVLTAGCPGTINFDNSAGTGVWTIPTNWDLDRLPGAADDVCIGPGFSVTLSSGTHSIQSLTTNATATLSFSTGTLTIASASTIGGAFSMSSGTLNGSGDVTVDGLLTWTGGTMAGGGTTHADGGLSIGGTSTKDLNPRILVSPVAATWTGTGGIRLGGGASIQNGGTWTAQNDVTMSILTGGGTFSNSGTLRKSVGVGTTTITAGFTGTGSVEIQSGTLSLSGGGTNSCAFTGSPGTTLRFNSTSTATTLTSASSVSVPAVIFDGGTVSVEGNYSATTGTTVSGSAVTFGPSSTVGSIGSALSISTGSAAFSSGETITPSTLTLSGGTLTGSDTVTVSGLLTWTGGPMTGGGTTNANGGLSVSGAATKDLNPRTLVIPGTATWTGTGGIRLGNGAFIQNGGLWDAQSDATISALLGGGTFSSSGTFRKSAGSGTTTVSAAIDSSGAVEIQTGTLSLSGGGTVSGSVSGSPGTTLRFNAVSDSTTLTSASSVSVPSVVFDAGTVGIDGAYAATTGTTVSGSVVTFGPASTVTSVGSGLAISSGTVTFSSGETIVPSTLTLSGGSLAGADTITVSGLTTWTAGAMTGGGILNADGGLSISGSPAKDLDPRALKSSGTAALSGSGSIRLGSGASIENTGLWNYQGDAGINLIAGGGTFTNSGTLRKSAGAGATLIGAPIDSPGVIEVQSGTLTLSGGGTISGGIVGGPSTTLRFSSNLGAYTLTSASSVSAPNVVFEQGTNHVGGAWTVTDATTISAGTVTFDPTSTVASIGSALTISGGSVSFDSGETISPATLTFSSGTLGGSDTVTVSGPSTWSTGTMTGGGITEANGGLSLPGIAPHDLNPRTLRTAGTVTWSGDSSIRLGGGSIIENSGVWEAQQDGSITSLSGSGSFANAGTFRKPTGTVTSVAVPFSTSSAVEALSGTLGFLGGFTQTAGTTTLNGGSITSTTSLDIQGGELRGVGTVGTGVTSAGQVGPGLSPGTLAVTGSYVQSTPGSFAVELGGTTPGAQHDRLDVTSAATLAGTLVVSVINAFVPLIGDEFTILTCGSRTGTFATTSFPPLPPGRYWSLEYLPTSVVLKVLPLPAGRLPGDLTGETALTITKSGRTDITISWGAGCVVTDTDASVYEGVLGNFTSHVPVACSTGGATSWPLTPGAGNRYYLIVPHNGGGEGSYGYDWTGAERPVSTAACHLQNITPCP